MKKYIVFGGFDYAVRFEMDQDAIFRGIDYFVDNDPALIGGSYLGKQIRAPEVLLREDRDDILILIGSIIHRTELEFQLKDMGFEEDRHFIWAVSFYGDAKCPRLWKHTEWNDSHANANNLATVEKSEYALSRMRVVARFIDFGKIDTAVDLGAANGRIREFIPDNIRYIPVDYIPYSDETVVCDLNKDEFPDSKKLGYDPKRTCILCLGFIQYIRNWKIFLRHISENCDNAVVMHYDFARISREYRRLNWTGNTALFHHELILQMLKNGFDLVDAADYRLRDSIYQFRRAVRV